MRTHSLYHLAINVKKGRKPSIDLLNVQSWSANDTAAQTYRFTFHSDCGYYTITNLKSGKVLDLVGAKVANGTNVQQYDRNNTLAQRWIPEVVDDAYVFRSAIDPDYVLDVAGAKNDSGTNVQIYKYNGTEAQKWYVIFG